MAAGIRILSANESMFAPLSGNDGGMTRWLWLLVLYGVALLMSPLFGVLDSPSLMLLWTAGGVVLMIATGWMVFRLIRYPVG